MYSATLAQIHSDHFRDHALAAARLVRECRPSITGPVVDLGCGPGLLLAEIAIPPVTAYGIDLSPEMIELAKQQYPDFHFRVDSILDYPLHKAEVICAIGEVLSYALHGQENPDVVLDNFFQQVREAILSDGIFLFDILLDRYHYNYEKTLQFGNYELHVTSERKGMVVSRTIETRSESGECTSEVHHQVCLEDVLVTDGLKRHRFEVKGLERFLQYPLPPVVKDTYVVRFEFIYFTFMRALILTTVMILLGFSCQPPQADQSPPNIIYILADDLGYGELGIYGQEKIETPHIDQLAREGMLFTQHYSGSPVCAPSRYMLLTGMHPGHAYIRGNDEWGARGDVWNFEAAVKDPNLEGQRPIPADTYTIGNLLQEAGYTTGLVGKWGLGGPLTDGIPNNRGFDFFYGYNCQRQAHQLYPQHLWRNREKHLLSNEMVPPRKSYPKTPIHWRPAPTPAGNNNRIMRQHGCRPKP